MARTTKSRTAAGEVRFESLAFQVEAGTPAGARALAAAVLKRALPGERWVLYPLNPAKGEFEAVPVARKGKASPAPRGRKTRRTPVAVSQGDAWDLAYRVRAEPEVAYAEPLFTVTDAQQQPPATRGRSSDDNDPGTEADCEWSVKALRVPQAWALFGTRTPGTGIVVGHPDTGFTDHPEILSRLVPAQGSDFEDEDGDAHDTLSDGLLRNPGHGTGTSSVIVSPRGTQGTEGSPFVSGVAPGATLIPIRTTRSVVLFSMSGLTRAIRHAVANGAHVVSISLGGPFPSEALKSAVRDAEAAGVIVCCAAGNQVRFVVFPAALDEVIAVAASRIDDTEWPGSCRGPAVDITAPGSSVWRARTRKNGSALTFDVERGSGTSFAVAATAGIAALWLSFHGRQALVARYGAARLASVFKQLLQATSRRPAGWDTGRFGAGIAHAERLLQEPLPPAAPARGLRGLARRAVSSGLALETLVHQLAPAPRSGVVRVLARTLDTTEEALPARLDDIGAELAMRVGLDPVLRDQLRTAAEAEAAPVRARSTRAISVTPARLRIASRGASRRLKRAM